MSGSNSALGKRKEPEKLDWDSTALDELTGVDIKQLLKNRDLESTGTKDQMKERLKKEGKVDMPNIESLTVKQITAELKLKNYNSTNGKKEILLARYRGEDTGEEPKKKKRKTGKKKTPIKCWVAVLTPPEGEEEKEEDNEAKAFGVYRSEREAYEAATEHFQSLLESKSEGDHKKLKQKIEKMKVTEFKEKYNEAVESLKKHYNDNSDPYFSFTECTME